MYEVLTGECGLAPVVLNQPPTITKSIAGAILVGQPLGFSFAATDPDDDPLSLALLGAPEGMSIDELGVMDWTPSADALDPNNAPTPYTFVASADDGRGGITSKSFTISVASTDVNQPPSFTSTPADVAVASALYRYQAAASDPEGDTLRFAITQGPSGMTVGSATGLVQWVPTLVQAGVHPVTLSLTDARGGLDSQTFLLDVGASNRPPVIESDPVVAAYLNETYSYTVLASDPDGHELTYSIDEDATTADANGVLAIDPASGAISWTPLSTDGIGNLGNATKSETWCATSDCR